MTHTTLNRLAAGVAFSIAMTAVSAPSAKAQAVTPPPPPAKGDTTVLLKPKAFVPPPRPSGIRASLQPPTPAPAPTNVPAKGPLPTRQVAAAVVATPPSLDHTSIAPPHLPPKHPSVNATIASRPAGATAHCKDGTYLTGGAPAAGCAAHGGVSAVFPSARVAPPAPVRRP